MYLTEHNHCEKRLDSTLIPFEVRVDPPQGPNSFRIILPSEARALPPPPIK